MTARRKVALAASKGRVLQWDRSGGWGRGGTSELRGFKALLLSIMNGAYRVLWGGGGIPETG